ncbi:MAG: GAF domain-containing protein [Dehalococcoidia bacterium]
MKIRTHRQIEEELSRVNRELRAISKCGQAIVKATDEQTLLNDVCHIICDEAGYRMAWVGMVEHDESKSVRPAAWGGRENGYLANVNITWADNERGRGPTGMAARSGKACFFQDFEREPAAAPWREAALSRGYRSSIAIPLAGPDGAVFAVFTLYADIPDAFIPSEVELLEELAADLAFGIYVLRVRAERDLAVAALQTNEEKFRLIATSTPDHILMQDSELRYILVVNPQLGLMQGDMIGKTDYEILAKEDADRMTEIKNRVLTSGNAEHLSTSLRARDGSQQYFEGTYVPIFDTNGNANGILGYFRNITERVKMEEDLLNSREGFQILSEANSLLLTSEKPEYMIQTIATKVMDYLGCDVFFNFIMDESSGRLRLNAFTGISLEAARDIEWLDIGTAICGCAARNGCRIVSENIQKNVDEKADLVRSFGIQAYACHPLRVGDKTIGTLSFGTRSRTSFTEEELDLMKTVADQVSAAIQRSRVEESLRETRDYLDKLFNYANAPIVVWDPDLRITRFNHAFEHLTGLTAEQAVGSKIDVLFPDNSRDASMKHILEATAGQRWEVVEIPIVHTDGTIRILLWNSASIYELDGKTIVATMAQGQDITERKKAEQVKDEFIGLVSHELKTPVTVIVGAIDTAMTKGVPKKEALQLLQDAAVSAEALAGIVDNLLELTRAQANRLIIKKEPVDIAKAAGNVIEKLKGRSTRHRLVVEIPKALPRVAADPIRVERILHNLVENAIKYSPKGGNVTVFASRNGDSLNVGVKDQGIGITTQDRERLFKPFERLGTVKNAAGVGLGLNVCRRLVEAHNGHIWVESEPGKGTTFYFSLPLSAG